MLNKFGRIEAISGQEDEMRNAIKDALKEVCDTLRTDGMGNLFAVKKGTNPDKKLFLVVPMDESGIIVSKITEDGYLKFQIVGRLRPEFLVSKRVLINGNHGVIGFKAVHLATKEEREKPVLAEDLLIDIGADSRREAEEYVTVGDYGVIDSDFITFGDEMIKGRALGSKLSCAVAVEVLKQTLPVTLEVVFTVQREVGCRGAITVPGQLAAEIGFILDGISEEEGVHCHKGAVLALKKSDREDTDTIERLAKNAGIALQTCMVEHSGQEAVFSKSEHVRRSICLGVPVRYQESAAQVAAQSDQEALLRLLLAWIAEYAKGGLYDGME